MNGLVGYPSCREIELAAMLAQTNGDVWKCPKCHWDGRPTDSGVCVYCDTVSSPMKCLFHHSHDWTCEYDDRRYTAAGLCVICYTQQLAWLAQSARYFDDPMDDPMLPHELVEWADM